MKLRQISKIYHNKNGDVKALNQINLSFVKSGMTFIVGESGCGKTTLINILCQKDHDYSGSVEYDGYVECIEQDIVLMENMSIEDNLLLIKNDKVMIDELLKRFHLFNKKQKVKLLSGGEKKRVQIIRSLLTDAMYFVCDEPTASLDHENSIHVMELLKELSKDKGIIIVTHDLALKDKYATRTIRMGKGCILEDEPVESVFSHFNTYDRYKSLKEKMVLSFKLMISRRMESFLKFVLLSFIALSLFCGTFLFSSISKGLDVKNSWYNGKNVLISYPNVLENGKSTVYDLYVREDISLVKDNIDGIIAYKCGWNDIYTTTGDNSFSKEMNIDELRLYVDKYRKEYETSGKEPVPYFMAAYNILDDIDKRYPDNSFDKTKILTSNYSSYRGFNWNNEEMGFPSNSDVVELGYERYIGIVPYQLISDIDIRYGIVCRNNNEVVLNQNVAEELCKILELGNVENIVGKKLNLKIAYNDVCEVIVSGVSHYSNRYENQVFFVEGAYDDMLAKCFDMNTEYLTYQYLSFIYDPYEESDDIIAHMNYLLESKDSSFVLYTDIAVSEEYQRPFLFSIFIISIIVFSVLLYIVIQILMNKRICKENIILDKYGYHSISMNYIGLSYILLIVCSIQIILLPYICHIINYLSYSLNMPNIVSYSISHYLVSFIILVIGIFIIDGVISYVRVKKCS